MIYDEELMLKDLENLCKTGLNAEIDIINAEKADALVLTHIPSDKYVFEAIGKGMLNYTGFFVMYGLVDNPLAESNSSNVIENCMMTLQIGTFDKGEAERSNLFYKLLRYRRALRSLILKNPDVFRGYAKASMVSLKPNAFPYDDRNVILTIGVDVKASVTAV